MNNRKIEKTIKTLRGKGAVAREGKLIAVVSYEMKISQEFLISRTQLGTEEIPGLKRITAQISVVDGERNLADGTILCLRLSDGQTWEFIVRKGDPITGIYSAVSAQSEVLADKQKGPTR